MKHQKYHWVYYVDDMVIRREIRRRYLKSTKKSCYIGRRFRGGNIVWDSTDKEIFLVASYTAWGGFFISKKYVIDYADTYEEAKGKVNKIMNEIKKDLLNKTDTHKI